MLDASQGISIDSPSFLKYMLFGIVTKAGGRCTITCMIGESPSDPSLFEGLHE